ncbi:MAG: AsmA family protein, partial [Gammaproteobacteria bacterium]
LDIEGEDLPALMRLAGLDDMAAQIRSASSARFSLSAKLDADAEAGTAQVSNLQAQVLGVKVQGDVNATATQTDNPALNGQISLAGESLGDLLAVVGQAALAENLKSLNAEVKFSGTQQQFKLEPINATATFAGKQLPQGPVDIALIATATANMANETLSIPSLAVKGMGLDVQATVDAKAILSTPQYSGNLKVAAFNLRQLMQQLALDIPDTSDDKTLTKVAVDTQYAGTTNSINLSNLVLQLDETTAKGNFGIIDLARQAVRMNLTVDKINADRYLPPATEAPATPETAAAGAAGLPLETLRALDIQGTLAIGELIISKAKLSDIKLNLNAKDGDIALAPASANVYSGKYQGAVNLNAKKDTPLVNIDSALTGININALLSDLRGEPSKLSGTADLQAKLDARGADADAFKRTLGGNVAFVVNDGSFKGVNIGHMLRQAGAVLEGGSLQAVPKEESTDFSELTGTLNIKDGLINNDDLAMKSPAIRLDGKGMANLVSEQVDYVLNASVAKTAEGQGGRELKAVGGYTVPVRCKGTFADPGCKPDLAGLAKARLQKELDKKSDGATKKVEEK